MANSPAIQAYAELQQAYDYFNEELFDSELPNLILTMQRGKNTFGYFAPERFVGKSQLSELAMNPDYFGCRSLADTLSTLVHEMCHVWQFYSPVKKCRGGYHDRIWGKKMEELGLMPSNTGQPNGKKTGQSMTHYIVRGGKFQLAVFKLLKGGFSISWYDGWNCDVNVSKINEDILEDWVGEAGDDEDLIHKLTLTVNMNATGSESVDLGSELSVRPPIKGASTRVKFSCASCGLNAWAKPSARLKCGDCNINMEE